MSHKDRVNTENLQVLLEQHWLHCRHLESERAWFMSVYAAITGGMFAFMAYSSSTASVDSQYSWPLYFLFMLTFFGFFHSMRWTYAFECHRVRVNKLAQILWIESERKAMLDPTMDIPSMRILPEFLHSNKTVQFLRLNKIAQYLNEIFRTRYLFTFFYFFMLIGFVILSFVTVFPIWVRVGAIIALVVAAGLFVRWQSSLQEIRRIKTIVLEGCNGEWAQRHYLPFLVAEADKQNTELWALDLDPQIKLATPGVPALWQSSRGKGKSCYIDKSRGRQTLDKPDEVSHIFIVTPDRFHTEVAASWLERLAPEGSIIVEKPLDASVVAARKLKKALEEKGLTESIYVFDHYLARAYPFLHKSNRYIKEIGGINQIEVHVLEPHGIAKDKASTFDRGVIFDLFCHVIALVCATVSQNTTCMIPNLATVKRCMVRGAKYTNCPISGETFAMIQFTINDNIEVVSKVGYYVGNHHDKFMKLVGTKGRIELNFVNDEFLIYDTQEQLIKKESLSDSHVETFLEMLLSGKQQPLSIPGVLSFDVALKILNILNKAKRQIGKMPMYRHNASVDQILDVLGEREQK